MTMRHQIEIDADLYAHASGLFDASRSTLTPDAVERLAREVLDRLAANRRDGTAGPRQVPGSPDPALVAAFCDTLLLPDSNAPLRFVQDALVRALPDREAFLDYVAAASRELGERWNTDAVTFVEVTSSVGKLYTLVRATASRSRAGNGIDDPRKTALFASVPGDRHTLGVTIAADMFRDAGWDIDLQVDRSHEELLARAERMQPAVVGLSLSGSGGLDGLARLVVAMRLVLPRAVIAVAGSGDMGPERLRTLIDLDLVITDAKQARRDIALRLGLPGD